jgi:hypothetical protein
MQPATKTGRQQPSSGIGTSPSQGSPVIPHVIFSRVDHRRSHYSGCECQQCTPTLYDIALGDPELAAELVNASKGGNVPGITEDHRFELMRAVELARDPDPIVSRDRLSIDDDYGTETYIKTIFTESLLGLRRAVRELNMGSIPIYSDYDCTGLVCGQWCKLIKIYKTGRGFTAVVEITVSRDV